MFCPEDPGISPFKRNAHAQNFSYSFNYLINLSSTDSIGTP